MSKRAWRPETVACRVCKAEPSEGNPVYEGQWAYIKAAVPLPLCLRCLEAIVNEQIAGRADLENVA